MRITTLGTSHGAAEPGRFCCATLVDVCGRRYLFDCGAPVDALLTNRGEKIFDISAIFVSHMHEDHVSGLTTVAKRFLHYQRGTDTKRVRIFLPEEAAVDAYLGWCRALHMRLNDDLCVEVSRAGLLYEDDVVKVTAVPTAHLSAFPTFAYMLEAEGKRIMITGDLNADFHDYPQLLLDQDFDAVVTELTHYSFPKAFDRIARTRTKQLIFTHIYPDTLAAAQPLLPELPFQVHVASDGTHYEV